MNTETMLELHKRWRGLTAEKAKEHRDIGELIAANTAEINKLRDNNARLESDFAFRWQQTKKDIQRRLDEAVMAELASRPAQSILRDLGSQNTVWIYGLRAKVAAAGQLPEQINGDSRTDSAAGSA